eukprot:2505588-Prymnesium_polylepis.2
MGPGLTAGLGGPSSTARAAADAQVCPRTGIQCRPCAPDVPCTTLTICAVACVQASAIVTSQAVPSSAPPPPPLRRLRRMLVF